MKSAIFIIGCAACTGAHDFGRAPASFTPAARAICSSSAQPAPTGEELGLLEIIFENQTSDAYRLLGVHVAFDESMLCTADRDDLPDAIPVGYGSVPAGTRSVSVDVTLGGNGYGIFSYLRDYRFEVHGKRELSIAKGERKRLRIIVYEHEALMASLEERPALEFIEW